MPRHLERLPKAHLHVHLENAVRWQTLAAIGRANGIDVPEHLAGGGYEFTSSTDFFDQNRLVRACLVRPSDFARIAVEFCEDEAAQGTRYAEASFTVAAHERRLDNAEMPLLAVLDGLAEGQARFGIQVQLILDHSRRRPVEQAWRTVELAATYADRGVVGVGLAGDEAYQVAPFAEVYRAAADRGLHVVHHAGEAQGAESILEALEAGHAERIGHGIRALDDASLVKELAAALVPLEVCPSSNVALGFVPSLATHPFRRLETAGLAVTINTDIPAMLNIGLADEYANVRDTFGYSDEAMAGFAIASVAACFAPASLKQTMLKDIDAWLAAPDPSRDWEDIEPKRLYYL